MTEPLRKKKKEAEIQHTGKLPARLILASASPRRTELLKLTGLDFEVLPSGIDESVGEQEKPDAHVLRLAVAKAQALANHHPRAWVLGADTTVAVDDELLGKPVNIRQAKAMLKKLSGRWHRVFTGITLICQAKGCVFSEVVASDVLFRKITAVEIARYAATPEPYDKAGGYALQGQGAFFIQEIHGSYTNVIGLPLCETAEILKRAGVINFPGMKRQWLRK